MFQEERPYLLPLPVVGTLALRPSLSGILCLRHSMSKRSIYANESKDRWGGHSGIAAHFV